ncbi:MAG: hypothetical protein FJX11_06760 [Alphaproteobacteria bacterium]|nr:hypothetical protein [Alphaproteobacteria bacterium]
MFQLFGGLLASIAMLCTLAGAPLVGILFAIATLLWVVNANPARRSGVARFEGPWRAVYHAPFSR